MRIEQAKNVSDIFRQRLADSGNKQAFRQFEQGQWRNMNWNEFGKYVARWQQALRNEGLQAGVALTHIIKLHHTGTG